MYRSQAARASASWLQLGEQTTGRQTLHKEFKGHLTGRKEKRKLDRQQVQWIYRKPNELISQKFSLAFTLHVCHFVSLFPLSCSLPWFCSIYDFLWNLCVSRTLTWAINQALKRTVDRRGERWKIRGRPSPSSEQPFKGPPESFKTENCWKY